MNEAMVLMPFQLMCSGGAVYGCVRTECLSVNRFAATMAPANYAAFRSTTRWVRRCLAGVNYTGLTPAHSAGPATCAMLEEADKLRVGSRKRGWVMEHRRQGWGPRRVEDRCQGGERRRRVKG